MQGQAIDSIPVIPAFAASVILTTTMIMKIERDQRRFRQIVRGRIRKNLRKYVTHGEMIGRKGRDLVSIPVPQLDVPHFRFGDNGAGGVGQGDGEEGQPIAKGGDPQDGQRPGRQRSGRRPPAGSRYLARRAGRHPRRRAGAAAHRAQGPGVDRSGEIEVQQHPPNRPRIAPALQAHVSQGAASGRFRTGVYEPDDPRVIPIRADKQYRSWNTIEHPRGQRGRHLHDGRLRLDDRRAEGDRPHRGVLDRYLAVQPIQGHRDALHHPRRGRQRGRRAHVLSHPRKRRHADQLGLQGVCPT